MLKIKGVATQMYVWGQVYGQQDYLKDALRKISQAGYEGIECNLSLASTQEKAEQLEKLLKKNSLKLASLYHGGIYHEEETAKNTIEETAKLAKFAKSIGCPAINVNPASKGEEKTEQELKIQAKYLEKMGKILKDMGMDFFCHNHTPEIQNNARELRAICDMTDKMFVNLCLDIHWVLRGGMNPLELMEEYPERLKSLHLRNSSNGIWMEYFGEGDIDYIKVKNLLDRANYEGWLIVELAYEKDTKITKELFENSKISREYVRKIFGV